MRTTIGWAVRRSPGGDLIVGGLATCLSIGIFLGVEAVAATRTMPLEVGVLGVLGVSLVTLASVPVLVGIYARVGRDAADIGVESTTNRIAGVPDGRLRETARLTAATLWRRGSTLLAGLGIAIVASLLVGVLATTVLHAVVLSVLTIAGYASYALGYGQLVPAVRMFHLSAVLVGLGLSIGVLSVRFFDCVICWTDAGPVVSVRESLRFTRTQPRTVLGYALVTTVLFAIPNAVFVAAATLHETLALGLLVLFTSASLGVYANFHARVCHQQLLPVCCGTKSVEKLPPADQPGSRASVPLYSVQNRPLVANPLAVALALLLVMALLVGSGTVRTLDVRPVDTPDEPGPINEFDDAAALISPDAIPQIEANHRAVVSAYAHNETQGRWVKSSQWRYEMDHQQRRYIVSWTTFDHHGEPTSSNTGYFSTKQFAMQWIDPQDPQPPSELSDRAWHERVAGNWVVYSVSGYEVAGEPSGSINATPEFFEQDWQVVDETHRTITLAVSGRDAVPVNERGHGPIETADVEVTIDRETGYVVEVSQTVHREDDELEPLRTHVEFENWGDHVVDRPAAIEVQAIEWIWGVASY